MSWNGITSFMSMNSVITGVIISINLSVSRQNWSLLLFWYRFLDIFGRSLRIPHWVQHRTDNSLCFLIKWFYFIYSFWRPRRKTVRNDGPGVILADFNFSDEPGCISIYKFTSCTVSWICGSTRLSPSAALTISWRNTWSTIGQTYEKLTSIC